MGNQSISRAAKILALFSYSKPQWRVTDIAAAMKLPIGTVHGIVKALHESGFLTKQKNSREYRLGLTLQELGAIQKATLEINQKASIPVSYLARDTGLLGRVGVFENDAIIVTMSTVPLEGGPVAPYMGPTVPAYCSAMGRAILAFMPEDEVIQHLDRVQLVKYTSKTITDRDQLMTELQSVREKGYAVSHQETLMHLDSIGAPVFAAEGELAGAISLNGHPNNVSGGDFSRLAQRVMDTAAEISNYMGYHVEPRFVDA